MTFVCLFLARVLQVHHYPRGAGLQEGNQEEEPGVQGDRRRPPARQGPAQGAGGQPPTCTTAGLDGECSEPV